MQYRVLHFRVSTFITREIQFNEVVSFFCAARVEDGSNTINNAVSQKIFIQKVIAALVGIALDFTALSLLSSISTDYRRFT